MVEHLPVTQKVAGSSPVHPAIIKTIPLWVIFIMWVIRGRTSERFARSECDEGSRPPRHVELLLNDPGVS